MQYVFSIFDRKSRTYSHHYVCQNAHDARRAMGCSLYALLVRNEDSPFLTFPSDYVFCVTGFIPESFGEMPDYSLDFADVENCIMSLSDITTQWNPDERKLPPMYKIEMTELLAEATKVYKHYLEMQE